MRWFSLLACLLLVACGGGGGSSSEPVATPPDPTRFVHFSYFAKFQDQLPATASYTTLTFESQSDLLADVDLIRQNKLHVILVIESLMYANGRFVSIEPVRALLHQLGMLGDLDLIVAFYPVDEPDLHYPDAEITLGNNALHALCKDFPLLGGCDLMVIYSDHRPVGLSSYDWVGTDGGQYGRGPLSMGVPYPQREVVIAGAADPWREAPDAYVAYAQANPQVVAVLAFNWFGYYDEKNIYHNGVRDNGTAKAWCLAGRTLTQKAGVC